MLSSLHNGPGALVGFKNIQELENLSGNQEYESPRFRNFLCGDLLTHTVCNAQVSTSTLVTLYYYFPNSVYMSESETRKWR